MSDCVVDASVSVKWAITEPDSAKAAQVEMAVTTAGGRLHLLDIALVEGTNAVWLKRRRGVISDAEATQAIGIILKPPATIIPALPLLTPAYHIAVKYGIAVYDALFVAAADSLQCDGVTADVPLVTAVGADFLSIKLLRNW